MPADVFRELLNRCITPFGLLGKRLQDDIVQVASQLAFQFFRRLPERALRFVRSVARLRGGAGRGFPAVDGMAGLFGFGLANCAGNLMWQRSSSAVGPSAGQQFIKEDAE